MKKSKLRKWIRTEIEKIVESKVNENSEYQIYHPSYTSAIDSALKYIRKMGYEIPEDEIWSNITTGPKRPSPGKTNRISLEITKDGHLKRKIVGQRKMAQIQIFNRGIDGNTYELNVYVN